MRNKGGIIGSLILSLFISGSVLAETRKTDFKPNKSVTSAKMVNFNNSKPKKHRKHWKHRKHRKHWKMAKKVAKTKSQNK